MQKRPLLPCLHTDPPTVLAEAVVPVCMSCSSAQNTVTETREALESTQLQLKTAQTELAAIQTTSKHLQARIIQSKWQEAVRTGEDILAEVEAQKAVLQAWREMLANL